MYMRWVFAFHRGNYADWKLVQLDRLPMARVVKERKVITHLIARSIMRGARIRRMYSRGTKKKKKKRRKKET